MTSALRLRDDRGGVALTFAVTLTVMIGFAGAATEGGTWLLTRRAMQGAADAAAVSALNAKAAGGPDITTQAKGVAAQNGWTDGVNGVKVTVNSPPTLGNYTGNAQAVEVIITQPQTLFLLKILPGLAAPTIGARAVVAPSPTTGSGCMLALGTGNSVQVNGNGNLKLNGCDIDGNGNLQFNGKNTTASVHSIDLGGTVNLPSHLTMTNPPGTQNNTSTFTDPNSLTLSPGACTTFKGTFVAGSTYCGGVSISGGNVTMPSGTYYIRGGSFSVSNGTLTSAAGGVTIVLMGTSAAPTVAATLSITGQANVNLSGQPGTTFHDLIFYEDPTATSPNGGDQIAGLGTVSLSGIVDLRNDTLTFGGNGSVGSPNNCLGIIVNTFIAAGNGTLAGNCVGTGSNGFGPGAGATKLVE
jgi:Flp pilus assembly protein TadG